jgi:aldose 1-epimerase
VLVEVGAAIREYAVGGAPVIDGFGPHEMADGGRGQPLLPWPNRLADGHYTFDDLQLQLPIDEVARGNASHGLTRWLNWSVVAHQRDRAAFEYVLHPRPGYPFTLALRIDYDLTDAGLRCRTTATNVGTSALPFGAGFHPYVTVGTPLVDEALLQVPAAEWLPVDERMLPTGERRTVSGTDLDFTVARRIGEQRIDACFGGLQRNADGYARAELCTQDGTRKVMVWMDAAVRYLQVFTSDTLASHRRRRGIAIEPMTCAANAFRTGTDLMRLEPDQQHTCVWGLTA